MKLSPVCLNVVHKNVNLNFHNVFKHVFADL